MHFERQVHTYEKIKWGEGDRSASSSPCFFFFFFSKPCNHPEVVKDAFSGGSAMIRSTC